MDNTSPNNSGPIVKVGSREYPLAVAEARCRGQARGFYWIAGVSLVNMVAIAQHWDFSMVIGLGVTQVLQFGALMAADSVEMAGWYGAAFAAIALFGFLGWRAGQIARWPFLVGMWLYAADSVLMLVFQEYLSFGFHVFWLVFLWAGLIHVRPIQDARRRRLQDAGPGDAPAPAKVPEFLGGGRPATAPEPQ